MLFNQIVKIPATTEIATDIAINVHAYFVLPTFVASAATSLPPPGSLTPMQETVSPAIAGAKNCLFNSSLPKLGRDREGLYMTNQQTIPFDVQQGVDSITNSKK